MKNIIMFQYIVFIGQHNPAWPFVKIIVNSISNVLHFTYQVAMGMVVVLCHKCERKLPEEKQKGGFWVKTDE